MKTRTITASLSVTAAAAICLLSISTAHAQSNRTWVSPSGDDSHNCSVNKPCRTFAGALAKTNPGGEIVVQDSGGFGPLTINKSVTIDGAGKYGGIEVSGSGAAVIIEGASTDVVVLRGLTMKGFGTASGGIFVLIPIRALYVEHCVISDFTDNGITPSDTAAAFITDTTVVGCSGAGIFLDSSLTKALIEHCRLENNGRGLYLLIGPQATVRDTVAAGNKNYGFECDWGYLNIENCAASNNGGGIWANVVPSPNGPSTVVVSNSIVTNNQTYGFRQSGLSDSTVFAVFYSRGNNTVIGNGTDVSGTITPLTGN